MDNLSTKKRLIAIVALILIAAISFFVLAGKVGSAKMKDDSSNTQTYLSEKRNDVLELTAVTATTAFAVSAIPGDMGTPIADELARLSGYFAIILTAIYFEKILAGISLYAVFKVLLPVILLILAYGIWKSNDGIKKTALRLGIFALILVLIVPVSVGASKLIEETVLQSHTAALSVDKEETESGGSDQTEATDESQEEKEKTDKKSDEKTGFLSEFTSELSEKADYLKDKTTELINSGKDKYEEVKEEAEQMLGHLVDSFAVLMITSCVVPLAVLFLLIWVFKLMFNVDVINKVQSIKKSE